MKTLNANVKQERMRNTAEASVIVEVRRFELLAHSPD